MEEEQTANPIFVYR